MIPVKNCVNTLSLESPGKRNDAFGCWPTSDIQQNIHFLIAQGNFEFSNRLDRGNIQSTNLTLRPRKAQKVLPSVNVYGIDIIPLTEVTQVSIGIKNWLVTASSSSVSAMADNLPLSKAPLPAHGLCQSYTQSPLF